MPIITPAYPSMCATHNVTESTRTIMMNEFKLGVDVVEKVMIGNGQWKDLFTKVKFFHAYKHYLQITSSSESAESQLVWSGLVEAKLRQLVLKLEVVDMINLAHPYVKGIDKVHYCLSPAETEVVTKGGDLPGRSIRVEEGSLEMNHTEALKQQGLVTEENENNIKRIFSTTFYIGFVIAPKIGKCCKRSGMDSVAKRTGFAAGEEQRKLNLVWPVQDFTKLVKTWDKFDEKEMKITIQSIKGCCIHLFLLFYIANKPNISNMANCILSFIPL